MARTATATAPYSPPSGALLLDKPKGISSARAVGLVRRHLSRKTRVGHTGTLDPLASGLMVVLIGRATRLSRYATSLDKRYTATAAFGATSDTLDAEGEISSLPDTPFPDRPAMRSATRRFTGPMAQIPPMASAVKVGGQRLYALHRKGLCVDREPRNVTVHALSLTDHDPQTNTATFSIHCSSGTYVRSLIADLATSLGTGAYLTSLRRDAVGTLALQDAIAPSKLAPDTIRNHIIPPKAVVAHLPALEVGEEEGRGIRHGRPIEARGMEGSFRVEEDGELLGVYGGDGKVGRAEVVLWG